MSTWNGNWHSNQKELSDKTQNLSSDGILVGNVTGNITGDVTGNLNGEISTSELPLSGGGLVGTSAFGAPESYTHVENGVIITTIKFDLTGLSSVNTANDVIGLSAGGFAYLGGTFEEGRGIPFKVELSCIETPVGGDDDINIVENASGSLAYGDAGGTAYVINGGDMVKGQTVVNNTISLTNNLPWYITCGTGDTNDIYTAGQYIVRVYGHLALA